MALALVPFESQAASSAAKEKWPRRQLEHKLI
jgi:hypothetical protein